MECPYCKKNMLAHFGCVIGNVKWICSCGYSTKYKNLKITEGVKMMSENEQNFINKINEKQSIIEWQKKAISIREEKIKELEKRLTKVLKWGRTQRDYAHKYYNQIKMTEGAKQ